MPDPNELLDEGIRRELGGALEGARSCFEGVVEAAEDPALLSEALWRLSHVHRAQCRWDEAISSARRSAEVAGAAGLSERMAEALNAEAGVHLARGSLPEARPLLQQVLELSSDHRMRGVALQNLGTIAAQTGDLDSAERHFSESFGCFQRAGYRRGEAMALNNQGRAALDRGRVEVAVDVLKRAIQLARAIQDLDLLALSSLNYAEALAAGDKLSEAQDMAATALGFFTSASNAWRRIECLRLLGDIHERQDDRISAVACWDQALAIATDIGAAGERSGLEVRLQRARGGAKT